MSIVWWRLGKYAPIVEWFRTSLFQGGGGDSTSPGGRVLWKEVDRVLSIRLELVLPGSMPERLMGTDCKFVGNMSTLVQIQLGPKIGGFTMKWYNTLCFPEMADTKESKKSNFLIYPHRYLFFLFVLFYLFGPINSDSDLTNDLDSYQDY